MQGRCSCRACLTGRVWIVAATHFSVMPKNVSKNASAYHGVSASVGSNGKEPRPTSDSECPTYEAVNLQCPTLFSFLLQILSSLLSVTPCLIKILFSLRSLSIHNGSSRYLSPSHQHGIPAQLRTSRHVSSTAPDGTKHCDEKAFHGECIRDWVQ